MGLDSPQQPPSRQFRQPFIDREPGVFDASVWDALQENQREIANAKVQTATMFGQLSTQIAGIASSVENLKGMIAQKADRDVERVYHGWGDERYIHLRNQPIEQREMRNSINNGIASYSQVITTLISLAAFVLAILKP